MWRWATVVGQRYCGDVEVWRWATVVGQRYCGDVEVGYCGGAEVLW